MFLSLFSGHKRAAVGYGSYDPYNRHNIGGMFNRRSGGWRSNSRFNGGWNQYGELLCTVCVVCFQIHYKNYKAIMKFIIW